MLPFGNLKYFNIRLNYSVNVTRERERDNSYWGWRHFAAYDLIIRKWPQELEITGVQGLWFRNSNIRFYTGFNGNVSTLVANVKQYAEPYATSLTSNGYEGTIEPFRIGTTNYSQIDDSGATIWIYFKNKKTGKSNSIAFGSSKSWKIGYGNWVEVKFRYNWIKDTNVGV